MKKLFMIILCGLILGSGTGCENVSEQLAEDITGTIQNYVETGNAETENDISEEKVPEESADIQEETEIHTESNAQLSDFERVATVEETVLLEQGGIKITATSLSYNNYSVSLNLSIENGTDKNLTFLSETIGYSANSINGYMIEDGYLNCEVAAGKKANDKLTFQYDTLRLFGIDRIADMEIGFNIRDDDYNDIFTGVCQIKTSEFDSYDYQTDMYKETIASQAAMNTYGYTVHDFVKDILYDENGIKMESGGFFVNRDGSASVFLEFKNETEQMVHVDLENIELNGIMARGSNWSSITIMPGKRGVETIDLDSVLDPAYRSLFGIQEIGTVAFSLSQRDENSDVIGKSAIVTMTAADADSTVDISGEEVFHAGGVTAVLKGLVPDSSSYSSDIHLFLLATNNSGSTITLTDEFNSTSVNDYMADPTMYSMTLDSGKTAILDIIFWEYDLEDISVRSVDDIQKIETELKVMDGWTTIDSQVVSITFD